MDWRDLSLEERELLNALCQGVFRLSHHALVRMGERTLSHLDVIRCGETAEEIIFRGSNRRYLVRGRDTLDCEMVVVAEALDDVWIVTVW